MGGKNCVIVDADADLDEVVPALLSSAFAFAGQKCSAASRTLVHETHRGRTAERMIGALETLLVGQAERFGTDVPPLIEARRARRASSATSSRRRRRGRRAPRLPRAGRRPLRRADDRPRAAARPPSCGEEIFGPVLTLETVASVEAACELVEALPYALTGGLFSRNPRDGRDGRAPYAGREPLRQPRDHRRTRRPPAVRREPPVGRPARRPAARATSSTSSTASS